MEEQEKGSDHEQIIEEKEGVALIMKTLLS